MDGRSKAQPKTSANAHRKQKQKPNFGTKPMRVIPESMGNDTAGLILRPKVMHPRMCKTSPNHSNLVYPANSRKLTHKQTSQCWHSIRVFMLMATLNLAIVIITFTIATILPFIRLAAPGGMRTTTLTTKIVFNLKIFHRANT